MKICIRCGATFEGALQVCTEDGEVLIDVEISPVMTDEVLGKINNYKASANPKPAPMTKIQDLPAIKPHPTQKWLLGFKLWALFTVLLVGSILVVVIGFGSLNKPANTSEPSINNYGATSTNNQQTNSNGNPLPKSTQSRKTYRLK